MAVGARIIKMTTKYIAQLPKILPMVPLGIVMIKTTRKVMTVQETL